MKRFLQFFSSFVLLFLGTQILSAQVATTYGFSQTNVAYTPITGGTVLGVAGIDDDNYLNLPIGFPFTYNGAAQTAFSVNVNGFIALGATVASSYTALSTGTTNNVIAGLNFDLQGLANGELRYEVLGTAPNRSLVVQWSNFASWDATTNLDDNFNFQIVLHETTNLVQVIYGPMTRNATARTAQVGLRGNANTDFNNRTTATDWAASAAGTNNAANMTFTQAVLPASGLAYNWQPVSFAVSNITADPTVQQCTGVPHTISATVVDGGGVASVAVAYSINGVAQAPIAMTLISGDNFSGTWGAIIPATTGPQTQNVSYGIAVTGSNGVAGTINGGTYIEYYLGLNAGPDQVISLGQTATLSATASDPSLYTVLITEVTHFETGQGATAPYPAFIPTAALDFDGLEISNIHAANPVDISGLQIVIWSSQTNSFVYTVPAGTVIPAGGVAVFAHNNTPNVPANRFFGMAAGLSPGSGTAYGYILRTASGTILDAVATSGFSFPAASGVTAAQWTGNIASGTGRAGIIRNVAADNNLSTDWVLSATGGPIQTMGAFNPNVGTINTTPGAFTWNPGGLVGQQISVGPFAPGSYTFTVDYTDALGCFSLDEVTILVPSCPAPTAVTATAITDVTATIGWVSGGGTVDSTFIVYGPAGFTPGNGDTVLVTGNPFVLTGLQASTAYQAYVYESCDVLDGESFLSAPVSFATFCSPFPLPGNGLANAIVAGSFPFTDTVSTATCYGDNSNLRVGPDVFFAFTAQPCATSITVSLCGSAFDTYLYIRDAANTTTIGFDDDGCNDPATQLASELTFTPVPGTTYVAILEAFTAGVTGQYVINISQTITVTNPVIATASTDPTCDALANGSASVSVTGGNIQPVSYAWSNGAATDSLFNLTAGTYTVTVTNACGGTATASVTLTNQFGASATATNASCNGFNDGAVDLTVTGGTAPYAFAWSDGGTDEDLTGLIAGGYDVTVSDAAGCSTSVTTVVSEPDRLDVVLDSIQDLTCYGANNGAVFVTISGGIAPFVYSWTNGATDEDLLAVPADNYELFVEDANGCTSFSALLPVTEPTEILVSLDFANDPTCFNATDGSIGITVSGGVAPYSFNWSNGATDEDILAIGDGSYTGTVTDRDGCTMVAGPVVLTQPASIAVALDSLVGVSCNGLADGAISVSANDGVAPYSFAWSNGSTDEDITGLVAGSYTGTVTDANGCTTVAGPIVVAEPDALNINLDSFQNVGCTGDGTGAIQITVNGGTAPYSFLWSNGATDEDLASLPAGSYTGTITDANGCTTVGGPLDITEPAAALTLAVDSLSNLACNGDNSGYLYITVSGGTAPYSYNWSNGATDEDLISVGAGAYTGTITDANGCVLVGGPVDLTEPTAIVAALDSLQNIACHGDTTGAISITVSGGFDPYTFNWSNGSTDEDLADLLPGAYTGTITDATGCAIVAGPIDVTEPDALVTSGQFSDVTCNGALDGTITLTISGATQPYSFLWSNGATDQDLVYLGPGTYTGTMTDANGCVYDLGGATISEPAALSIDSFSITNVSCFGGNDGAADIVIGGGVQPYTYLWDNGATDASISGLTAGLYNGQVTDANGCVLTGTLPITEPAAALSATLTASDATTFGGTDGSVSSTVQGGTAPYAYDWNNGATTADLTNVGAGTYTVTVTDANGCSFSATATVDQPVSVDQIAVLNNLQLFPNPTNGALILAIELASVREVSWTVISATGQMVKPIETRTFNAAQIGLDLSDLPNGLYLVRLVIGDQVVTKSVTLTK